jgi:hypothetical protein
MCIYIYMFTPPSRTYIFICDLTIYIYRQTSYGPLTLPVTATSGFYMPKNYPCAFHGSHGQHFQEVAKGIPQALLNCESGALSFVIFFRLYSYITLQKMNSWTLPDRGWKMNFQ